MEHISVSFIPHIRKLRRLIIECEYMTDDEKSLSVDHLDAIQEFIAYAN